MVFIQVKSETLRQTFLLAGFFCVVVITPRQFGFVEFWPLSSVVSDLFIIFTFTLTD